MPPGVPSYFQNYLAKWGRPGFSSKRPPSRGRAHTPFVVLSVLSPELRSQTDVPTFTWSIVCALQNCGNVFITYLPWHEIFKNRDLATRIN
jgi:hypothetical protein